VTPPVQFNWKTSPTSRLRRSRQGLSLGNREDVVWVRLKVPALPNPDDHWVLQMQPAMLQEVTVFAQNANGQWQHQALGLAHAFHERPLNLLNPAYPLKTSDHPRLAYLRVKTATSPFRVSLVLEQTAYRSMAFY